jgi:phenylacetate-CoA ligase
MEMYPLLLRKVVMPVAGRVAGIEIWKMYRRMMETERLSLEELRHLQLRSLREIFTHAYERVPFYRARFEEAGFRPEDIRDERDVSAIPPTTKDDIMSNFPEGITARGMDRSRWKYVASSGTTRQIMGIHDFQKANMNWAAGLRAHKLAGNHDIGQRWMEIPPHMCTSICGVDDSAEAEGLFSRRLLSLLGGGDFGGLGNHLYQYFYSRRHNVYRRVTLPSFGSEGTNIPEDSVKDYIDRIRAYRPHLLEGLPLYLFAFAKHVMSNGTDRPAVDVVKPFGGSLTDVMKEKIGRAFGCEVHDTYGCSETGFIACDCEKHDGLHLFMDLYHVDICRGGERVAPGELGRVYVTDLQNMAMPWLRYELGDVGRYYVDDHGCGRKSVRLSVEGRVEDTLVNTRGEPFTSDAIFDFFHRVEGIDNFQLIEKSRGVFDVLCVPLNGSRINRDDIARRFREFFDPEAFVKAYTVKTIKAEDGGKFRFVKSKSHDRF